MSTAATAGNGPYHAVQREIVFCHRCHNNWFRDESGLQCPFCFSDFVEILEDHSSPSDSSHPRIPGAFGPPFVIEGDADTDDDMDDPVFQHRAQVEEAYSLVEGPNFRITRRTRISSPALPGGSERRPESRSRGGSSRGNRNDEPPDINMLEMVQQIFANIMGDGSFNAVRSAANYSNANNNSNNDNNDANQSHGSDQHREANDASQSPQPILHGYEQNQASGSSGLPPLFPPLPGAGRFNIYESNVNSDGSRTVRTGPQIVAVEDIASVIQSVFGAHGDSPGGLFGSIMSLGGPGRGSGDYVWSETQLDRILSELMEQHQGNAPPPAQQEVLNNLPKMKIDQWRVDEGEDCAVCKEEWVLNEEVVQLPCKHIYHEFCVKKWLEVHDTCPICRKPTSQHNQNQGNPNDQQNSNTNNNNNNNNNNSHPANSNHDHSHNNPPRPTARTFGLSFNIFGHNHSHHNSNSNGSGRSGPVFPHGIGNWGSNGATGNNSPSGQNSNRRQRSPGDRSNNSGSR